MNKLLSHHEHPWYHIRNLDVLKQTKQWFVLKNLMYKNSTTELEYQTGSFVGRVMTWTTHINVHHPKIAEAALVFMLMKTSANNFHVVLCLPTEESSVVEYNQFMLEEILNDR